MLTEWYESSKWDTEAYSNYEEDSYEDSADYDWAVEERCNEYHT